jgi:hypothetical protein
MNENNFYFEQQQRFLGELDEEKLIQRISECQMVVTQLTENPVWTIVLKDASQLIKKLDDSWQDFPDGDVRLKEMRILKLATKHIIELPIKYAQDLDASTSELEKRQKPEEIINKDTDNE